MNMQDVKRKWLRWVTIPVTAITGLLTAISCATCFHPVHHHADTCERCFSGALSGAVHLLDRVSDYVFSSHTVASTTASLTIASAPLLQQADVAGQQHYVNAEGSPSITTVAVSSPSPYEPPVSYGPYGPAPAPVLQGTCQPPAYLGTSLTMLTGSCPSRSCSSC